MAAAAAAVVPSRAAGNGGDGIGIRVESFLRRQRREKLGFSLAGDLLDQKRRFRWDPRSHGPNHNCLSRRVSSLCYRYKL